MSNSQTTPEEIWALFKDGKQVSKSHSTKIAVQVEALESGVVWRSGRGAFIGDGYEIRKI